MRKKRKLTITLVITLLLLPKMIYFFSNFGYDTGRTETFTDQNGERSVTVKQDFASRPHVFYKGKRIFAFVGSGFMENVQWNVIFLDENTIALKSVPHIGEYFEIKLKENLDNIGSDFVEELQYLLLPTLGGLIFLLSPCYFCYIWSQNTKKVTAKLVNFLSFEEKEHLKEREQEFILNEQYCWKQKGKIMETKPKGKRIVCKVLCYNEELPHIPSYENFRYSMVKPTRDEFNQLKLEENVITTLVIRTKKEQKVVITGFWLKLDG